jgi:two-component system, NarL family, nitrate/nitrite response regulator NarL
VNPSKEAYQGPGPKDREGEASVKAAIVGRDFMSSDLLVHALVQNLNHEAVAVRPSDLLELLGARNIDLVIISADVEATLGCGFDLAADVSSAHPRLPILILLGQSTSEAVTKSFRSGARGVFERRRSMSEFLDCVEHVRKGLIWAGQEETNFVVEAFRSSPSPVVVAEGALSILTTRELQVVRHAATGKTNKAIAGDLGLSEHTVKNYLFRAFDKLGVSSRVELLFYLTIRGQTFGGYLSERSESDNEMTDREPPVSLSYSPGPAA